ncbi:MAG: VWA domain-containing protein [Planctomycetota bacterium]
MSEGFELLRPGALWAPFLALVLGAVGAWGLVGRRRERESFVAASQLARFLPGFSATRAVTRVVLAVAAVAFLGVSLLGPVHGHTFREVTGRGVDIVVCVDTSRSMLARDVRPSRLDRAKREVRGLLDVIAGDRIALIAFSGDAREVAPLTHDRNALVKLVDRITPADNRLGGTDLAAAVERALSLFDGRTGAHEAIVLLTDGEDLSGAGRDVAREAAERGIRVYVVGVGTSGGGKIPVLDEEGAEAFLRDKEGSEVVTRMDRQSLARVAEVTGGEFLTVDEHPAPLEELYRKRISQLEGREIVGGKERIPHDRYQWTLAVALACMLSEAGLRERGRVRGGAA